MIAKTDDNYFLRVGYSAPQNIEAIVTHVFNGVDNRNKAEALLMYKKAFDLTQTQPQTFPYLVQPQSTWSATEQAGFELALESRTILQVPQLFSTGRISFDCAQAMADDISKHIYSPNVVPGKTTRILSFQDLKALRDRMKILEATEISLGWNQLDPYFKLRKGSNNLIVANSNGGKSLLMQNVAAFNTKLGKSVLIITTEMTGDEIATRLARMLYRESNLDLVCLKAQKEGTIVFPTIQKVSAGVITPRDVRNIIRAFPSELVILDYMTQLIPQNPKLSEVRFVFKSISDDIQRIAEELQVPILTAVQANRSNLESDGSTSSSAGYGMIGESGAMVDSITCALNILRPVGFKSKNMFKLMVTKSRHGANDGVVYLQLDTDTLVLTEIEHSKGSALEEVLAQAARDANKKGGKK